MAITIVGTRQLGQDRNGADVTLTFDGTPAEDDVVVVIGGHGNDTGSDPIGPSTAGYTTEDDTDDGADDWTGGVWTKVLGASPDATVVCQGSGQAADATVYASFVLRGVDTANIMDAVLVLTSRVTTDNPDPDSITTVTDGAWVIAAAIYRRNTVASVFPSGYINTGSVGRVDTNRMGIAVATREIATFGAENPSAFTVGVSGNAQAAYTIAIRPAVSTEPEFTVEVASEQDTANEPTHSIEPVVNIESAGTSSVANELALTQEPAIDLEAGAESDTAQDIELEIDTPVTPRTFYPRGIRQAGIAGRSRRTQRRLPILVLPEPVFNVEVAAERDIAGELVVATEPVIAIEEASEANAGTDVTLAAEPVIVAEGASEADAGVDIALTAEPVLAIEEGSESDVGGEIVLELATTDIIQQSFRWRATDPTGVNANAGPDWAAAKDADVTEPIQDINPVSGRVRIGLRNTSGGTINVAYELQYSKDGGAFQAVPVVTAPWSGSSPDHKEVALVPSSSFINGAATTEILADAGAFVAGEGRETNPTGAISLADGEDTELEFKLLFRKWSQDGHAPDGTTFDFRLRDVTGGQPLGTYTQVPRLTIALQAGNIGGAYVETPGNVMVADDDGNLYAIIEPTDADTGGPFFNELIVVKSADGGDSWSAPDLANRPGVTFNDIEAGDMHYVAADDRIYIAWHTGGSAYYVEFNTAGHASPDEYGTVEEIDGAITGSPRQGIAIIRRASDGVTKVIYKDTDGTDQRLSLKSRTSGGTWDTSPTDVDGEGSGIHGVGQGWMAIDASNVIHMIYAVLLGGATDGDLYHREISTGDSLSGRTAVNDGGTLLDGNSDIHFQPHVPPVIYDDGGTERIAVVFVAEDDVLYFTQSPTSSISFITDEAVSDADVAMGLGGSDSATATLAMDNTDDEAIAIWVDESSEAEMTTDTRVSGSWGTDDIEVDVAPDGMGWVRSFVFTHSSGNGGQRVDAILYDVHPSPGGTGGIKYREIVRVSAPVFNVELASEADVATEIVVAVEPRHLIEIAGESDVASDTAHTADPVIAVEAASESDVANDSALVVEPVVDVEPGSESDVAQDVALAPEPAVAIEQGVESDVADDVTLAAEPVVALEVGTESDVAQEPEFGPDIGVSVDQATESDVADDVALSVEPVVDAELGTESDVAADVALLPEPAITIEVATERNTAPNVIYGPALFMVVEQASERDQGQDVALTAEPVLPVEAAGESDVAQDAALSTERALTVEAANEADSANDVALTAEPVFNVENAAERNVAQDVDFGPEAVIFEAEPAAESDTADEVELATERALPIEVAGESDAAADVVFAPEPAWILEPASESNTANDTVFAVDVSTSIEAAGEADVAQDATLIVEPVFVLEQADESDVAGEIGLAPEPLFTVESGNESDVAVEIVMVSVAAASRGIGLSDEGVGLGISTEGNGAGHSAQDGGVGHSRKGAGVGTSTPR
jgi:hypothetical protein